MEGRKKPHTDKYKEITNDWNYDASCTLTSLSVSNLENLKSLIFVAQSSLYITIITLDILYSVRHITSKCTSPNYAETSRFR
jgi:hypothetical protein